MIAHEHRWPVVGNVVHPLAIEPVDGMHQQPGDETQHELRHQRVDVDRDHRVAQRGDAEQRPEIDMPLPSSLPPPARRPRAQRIEDVVGGDDACAMAGFAAHLDQYIERHDEEAAKEPESEVEQHPQRPARQVNESASGAAAGNAVGGAKRSCANSVSPIDPNGTSPISTSLPESRSQSIEPSPMPTVKIASSSVTGVAVTAEHGKGGKLREQRAVKPEPRDAENRQKHGAVVARETDVARRVSDKGLRLTLSAGSGAGASGMPRLAR